MQRVSPNTLDKWWRFNVWLIMWMVWQGCEGSPQKRKCGPLGTPELFPWGSWRNFLIQINTMIFGECWNPHSCRSRKYYSHVCHGRGPVCKCRGLTPTHWLVIEVQGWACNVDGLKVVRNLLREVVQTSWIPGIFSLGSWCSFLIHIIHFKLCNIGECLHPYACRSRTWLLHKVNMAGRPICKCRGLTLTDWLISSWGLMLSL